MKSARMLLMTAVLVVASCGSGDEGATDTTGSGPTAPVTTPGQASSTAAEPTTSIQPTTTSATATTSDVATTSTATTVACSFVGSTDPVEVDFPMKLSSLIGSGIRTGAHECFERVVIEFEGTGEMPGYRVRYVDDADLRLSPSDLPTTLAGDATLVIQAGSWMGDIEGEGYTGPQRFTPTDVVDIEEILMLENFEGMFQWGIGLDRERPFSVSTLADPPRLVVDIATG